jgi:hypothetical protein
VHSPEKQDSKIESGHEIVFTVTDYWDGPRKGIANFNGKPHFYECFFDPAKDDYSELYYLTPLDEPVFQLAMEAWGIWRRWELAFHNGETGMDSHPALPQEKSRHKELKTVLDDALKTKPDAITRIGKFSVLPDVEHMPGVMRPLQVHWLDLGT